MSKPKPRTMAAATGAIRYLEDAQGCLKALNTCLDVDSIPHDHGDIADIAYKIQAQKERVQVILDGLKKALTNVAT